MYSIEVLGLDALRSRVRSLPKQLRFAGARALNDVGFAARNAVIAEMGRVFDRPTPFVLRSLRLLPARPDKLSVILFPDSPGGKAVDPTDVLRAEVLGGARKLKRSERAFQRIGVLPQGKVMVPAAAAPRDSYGNVPGPFIVRLLSYFQAFGEQGYRANMKAAGIRRLAGRANPRMGPPRRFAHIGGVEYFISRGRGEFTGRGSWRNGQQQHLPAGIWQRSGTHGSDVKPVFLFVNAPRYAQRLRMGEIIAEVVQRELPQRFHQRLTAALATAR